MRKFFQPILFKIACLAATLLPGPVLAHLAFAVMPSKELVSFNVESPRQILTTVPITGLGSGEDILAIDFRPATGELYALGSLSRLYVLDTRTGVATQVGASGAFTLNGVGSGGSFGFDFNPTVDRIRVTSTVEQNLRLNPANGALAAADAPLAYAAGDVNQGADPSILSSAYTNNVPGATTTALYGIDTTLNTLVLQNPPNNGTLNTVGPLNVDPFLTIGGFDIVTANGVNTGYAVLHGNPLSNSKIYRIDLSTGAATEVGESIGSLVALAIVPAATRLANIATRGLVYTGDNVLIAGFIIEGVGPRAVLIRARGPSLAQFGVPGTLPNPQLQLYSGQTVIASNDNWGDAPNAAAITASCYAPQNPFESAILTTLPPGPYTAIVSGVGGTTGVGIVEVFPVDGPGGVCTS
jgi:hypothetical protein